MKALRSTNVDLKRSKCQVIHLKALYTTYEYFSGATLRICYLLYLEADVAGDHIRSTFEKFIDAHPHSRTARLVGPIRYTYIMVLLIF